MTNNPRCPFCNILMYEVVNEEYPRLETYLCYRCGFHADTILIGQKTLYQKYQELFANSNGILIPKKLPPPKFQQPDKTPKDSTESKINVKSN